MKTLLLLSMLWINLNALAQDSIIYVKTKNNNTYKKMYYTEGLIIGNAKYVEKENDIDWRDYYDIEIGNAADPRDVVKRYIGPYLKYMHFTEDEDYEFDLSIKYSLEDGAFLHLDYLCPLKMDSIPIEAFEQVDLFLKEYGGLKRVTSVPKQPKEGIHYISLFIPYKLTSIQKELFPDLFPKEEEDE